MKILAIPLIALCTMVSGASLYFYGSREALSDVTAPEIVRYRIDPKKSEFLVHTSRSGLAWFKGHEHLVAVREFSGEAALTLNVLNPASLKMTIDAASLEETSPTIPAEHKKIIDRELDEIVLESARYPEIKFESTEITGGLKNGAFEVKVGGDISLHGVTRHIVIPVIVTVDGDTLRARGKFEIDRSDFNVKAPSAFHGLVRVGNKLKFDFNIAGLRL